MFLFVYLVSVFLKDLILIIVLV